MPFAAVAVRAAEGRLRACGEVIDGGVAFDLLREVLPMLSTSGPNLCAAIVMILSVAVLAACVPAPAGRARVAATSTGTGHSRAGTPGPFAPQVTALPAPRLKGTLSLEEALAQHGVGEARLQSRRNVVQQPIRREQDECAPARRLQDAGSAGGPAVHSEASPRA